MLSHGGQLAGKNSNNERILGRSNTNMFGCLHGFFPPFSSQFCDIENLVNLFKKQENQLNLHQKKIIHWLPPDSKNPQNNNNDIIYITNFWVQSNLQRQHVCWLIKLQSKQCMHIWNIDLKVGTDELLALSTHPNHALPPQTCCKILHMRCLVDEFLSQQVHISVEVLFYPFMRLILWWTCCI